jgi:lipid A disaccharide synthetase
MDAPFHVALANEELLAWAKPLSAAAKAGISTGDAHQRMRQADLVLVASGTAALELALIGVPMVVVYKLSAFSYFIVSKLFANATWKINCGSCFGIISLAANNSGNNLVTSLVREPGISKTVLVL